MAEYREEKIYEWAASSFSEAANRTSIYEGVGGSGSSGSGVTQGGRGREGVGGGGIPSDPDPQLLSGPVLRFQLHEGSLTCS